MRVEDLTPEQRLEILRIMNTPVLTDLMGCVRITSPRSKYARIQKYSLIYEAIDAGIFDKVLGKK